MTEQKWLESKDPLAMLSGLWRLPKDVEATYLNGKTISERKLRLFACACCRLTQSMHYPEAGVIVSVAEHAADLGITKETVSLLRAARKSIDAISGWFWCVTNLDIAVGLHSTLSEQQEGYGNSEGTYHKQMAALLRDIAGNPHRPIVIDPTYRTATVLALANSAYEERPGRKCLANYGVWFVKEQHRNCQYCHGTGYIADGHLDPFRLAILADALEDAGMPAEDEKMRGGPEILAGKECPYCANWPLNSPVGKNGWVKCERWRSKPGYGREHREEDLGRCNKCNRVWEPGYDTVRVVKRWPNQILTHLRSPGPHVRGCHVLDALLGKE